MKRYLLILSIGAFSFLSFKAADYFEIAKNLEIFVEVYKEVNTTYVDETKPGKLIRAAIDGMLKSLDPYTNFYSEAQAEDYRYQVTGTYAGIGAAIKTIDDQIFIDSPLEGFPCQQADLRAGDEIIAIDGVPIQNKSTDEIKEMLKGNVGSIVEIEVNRLGAGILKKRIERKNITQKNVPYAKVIDGIGYIKLVGFTPNAGKEVRDAVVDLKNSGAKELVLDLRNNGGGLLNEAINIVNVFVPRGQVVVETRGKFPEDNRMFKTLNSPVDTVIPLAILINGRSASASEIVAGAIQDLDRGILIGNNSFGKGLVQTTKGLVYNTSMKITTAKYFIPSGRLIQRLDYSNKVDGRALAVADSTKQSFKTKNGRTVIDGQGIEPDVKVDHSPLSELSQSLRENHLFFKFGTVYVSQHDTLVSPLQFQLSDAVYKQFCAFIKDKKYAYTTRTEKEIKRLETQVKKDKYDQLLSTELAALRSAIQRIKTQDTENYRAEITELLEWEIARRYYFERGGIEARFDEDIDWEKSVEILSDAQAYNHYLNP